MGRLNFLNSEPLIDPFLMERRGYISIIEGMRMYNSGYYEQAIEKFYSAIKYVTFDFRGNDAKLLKRAGVFLYDPNDYFDDLYSEMEEEEMNVKYKQKLTVLKINASAYNYNTDTYKEIVGSCFILAYSKRDESLKQTLEIINQLNNVALTPLSFYITMKILVLLDREDELGKEFDNLSRGLEHLRIPNLHNYAAIRYLKLFLNRKENSIEYLISLLEFYLTVPYSSSVINLLAKYQFDDHLSIDYDVEVLPKIAEFKKGKSYDRLLSDFKSTLSFFPNLSFTDSNSNLSSAGYYFKYLIHDIEPTKCRYKSLKFLRLFYFLMYKKLDCLKEFQFAEFKKKNPDFDENDYYDQDYDEPYSYEDFINDVFEGDESYRWNID